MKKIIMLLLLVSATMPALAQQALFDKYENVDGVTTVYISSSMLNMMSSVKAGDKDIGRIAKRLDHVQILSCELPSVIGSIRRTAQDIFRKQNYKLVMRTNDDGELTTIYERQHAKGKNEFVLLSVEKDEISVINILGNVTLADIQGIAGGK